MSIAATILIMLGIMAGFGTIDPLLERLEITKGRAMTILLILFAGSMVPPVHTAQVRMLPGILLAIIAACILLLQGIERKMCVRSLLCGALTAALLAAVTVFLPYGMDEIFIARHVLLGLTGGILAGTTAGDGKGAAVAGMMSAMLFDLTECVVNALTSRSDMLLVGHTELADQAMIAMVAAVASAVIVETGIGKIERMIRKVGRT